MNKEWIEVTWLGYCEFCNHNKLEVLTDSDPDFLENGTYVRCKKCGEEGITESYSEEEVVVAWENM